VDVLRRIISNRVIGAILVLQFSLVIFSQIFLLSGLAILLFGFILYWRSWLAAGDIKLASVLALAIPLFQLPTAVVLTCFVGGVLALFYLVINYWFPDRKKPNEGIPFGVAIGSGFFLTILQSQAQLLL
jgi:prepilin peptidase CpaA